MVKNKTIYQEQIDKNPDDVQNDMKKLGFVYHARIMTIIAKTCGGLEGKTAKQCFKEHAEVAGDIYSLEDFYSDNYNNTRNKENSLETSIKILKNIFSGDKNIV